MLCRAGHTQEPVLQADVTAGFWPVQNPSATVAPAGRSVSDDTGLGVGLESVTSIWSRATLSSCARFTMCCDGERSRPVHGET